MVRGVNPRPLYIYLFIMSMEKLSKFIKKYRNETIVGVLVFLFLILKSLFK